jgi:hypothetical protein
MTPIVITALGLGLGGGFLYLLNKKNGAPAHLEKLASEMTDTGPGGELVFKPAVAQTLQSQLAGMIYTMDGADRSMVRIDPEARGAAPAPDLSALQWARIQNRTLSILAPLILATTLPEGTVRHLRAVAPGHEADFAKDGYAVLYYGGSLDRGQLPPGYPPARAGAPTPQVLPTAQSLAVDQMHPALVKHYTSVLRTGTDAHAIRAASGELKAAGLHAAGALLANKAASLDAQDSPRASVRQMQSFERTPASPGTLTLPWQVPPGWAASSGDVQSRLIRLGMITREDLTGSLNAATIAGVKAFQRQYASDGLPVTGQVNSRTWDLLSKIKPQVTILYQGPTPVSASAPKSQNLLVQLASSLKTTAPNPRTQGSTAPGGWRAAVRTVQTQLLALGLLPAKSADGRPSVDGVRGPMTDRAVRAFQKAHDLPSDGIVDAPTAQALQVSAAGAPALKQLAIAERLTAQRQVQNAMAGGPMYYPARIPQRQLWGAHPMDRFAPLWGYTKW